MKSIWNVTRFVAVALVAGLMIAPRADATTISVTPPVVNTVDGANFSVDVVVSGLTTDAVGGASFFVTFDDTLLKGTGFSLDPGGKMGAIVDFSSGFAAGGTSPFEGIFLADATLDNTALLGLQGSGFILATLNFTAIAPGTTGLNLSFEPVVGAFLSKADGVTILPADAVNACVTVAPNPNSSSIADVRDAAVPCGSAAAVPEPATFGLLAGGLAMLARRRRKTQA